MKRRTFIGSALAFPFAAAAADLNDYLGPNHRVANYLYRYPRPAAAFDLTSAVLRWNQIALDATGLDHTPVGPGESRVYGEQLGPCRASRAMAMAHLAVYNAVTAGRKRNSSTRICVAQAACDTLANLYPSQTAAFQAALADELAIGGDANAVASAVQAGRNAALALDAARANDGAQVADPKVGVDWITSSAPGVWQQDPISLGKLALGAYWGKVTPFALRRGSQFRLPPPPALTSNEYLRAFLQAATLGGDGITTATLRTPVQTTTGTFWAYDGTPSLCAPPRLYNELARTIAAVRDTQGLALLRLLTVANVAMADTAIAAWDSKYVHNLWRPVSAIRAGGAAAGGLSTSGLSINAANWTPLGAPASNLNGPNFTPPFPSYPSGHAAFGGALFQTLRRFYQTDEIPFTFTSDEFNGVTQENDGVVRPVVTRTYPTLSAAEEENGQSRIYLGIHWRFDKTDGISQGNRVADFVFDHFASAG
jgi:membrane-associated phospholipid phosphatase